MNELIKDLGLKAAYQFDLDDPKFLQKYSEKFAELIINECARRCKEIALKHQVEETTYAAGKKAGAFECADAIRELK